MKNWRGDAGAVHAHDQPRDGDASANCTALQSVRAAHRCAMPSSFNSSVMGSFRTAFNVLLECCAGAQASSAPIGTSGNAGADRQLVSELRILSAVSGNADSQSHAARYAKASSTTAGKRETAGEPTICPYCRPYCHSPTSPGTATSRALFRSQRAATERVSEAYPRRPAVSD